jgi:hypothetical protein
MKWSCVVLCLLLAKGELSVHGVKILLNEQLELNADQRKLCEWQFIKSQYKVKLSQQQAVKTHRVVRRRGFHIF